jgi:hypothetical protein
MNSAPIKPLISTSDLDKIDVRIGTILAVEDVAHSETRRRAGGSSRSFRQRQGLRHREPTARWLFKTETASLFSAQSRRDFPAL